jgi:hypothetical protein
MSSLPRIYAPLDPKVAPLVEALRREGFHTTHSCDGHGENDLPWVTVRQAHWNLGELVNLLLRFMREHNLQGNVSVVHSTEAYRAPGAIPFLKMEVFSDLSEARF